MSIVYFLFKNELLHHL